MSQSTIINEADQPDTIADILNQGTNGRRHYYRLAWTMGILAVLAMIGAFLEPLIPRSPAYKAHLIMDLPKDATVIQVVDLHREGFGEAYGQVYFTLPEPKGPGSRIEEIWTRNGLPSPSLYARYGVHRVASKAPLPHAKTPPASAAGPKRPVASKIGAVHAARKAGPVARKGPVAAPSGWSFGSPYMLNLRSRKDEIYYDAQTDRYILQYQRNRGRYYYEYVGKPHASED